jgi:AraC family cel operon transcriptional repressor
MKNSATSVTRRMDTLAQNAKRLFFKNLIHPDSPIHIADSLFTDSNKTQPHHHDFYECYLVKKGSLVEYRKGSKNIYHYRSLVLVPPSACHCFSNSTEFKDTLITNVAFPSAFLREAHRFLNNPELQKRSSDGFALRDVPILLWERTCRHIEQLQNNTVLGFREKESLFKAVLIDIITEQIIQTSMADTKGLPGWLKETCDKIQTPENLREGLKRFIALSGRTQEHLTRTLKKETGKTPTEYINQYRLKNIATALSSTNRDVTTLAYQSGYNNLSYFNALFKKAYGLSPRSYRNRQGQDVVPT